MGLTLPGMAPARVAQHLVSQSVATTVSARPILHLPRPLTLVLLPFWFMLILHSRATAAASFLLQPLATSIMQSSPLDMEATSGKSRIPGALAGVRLDTF